MLGTRTAFDVSKRLFDVVASALALLVFAPVITGVAILVAIRLGRPVLFKQPRPGRHGDVFHLIKFRTMLPVDHASGAVTNAQRMTPFGARLRATSLDELPSLWNVIRGDMSLVGPRPLLVEYLPLYTPAQFRRHEVRPGLTGWAQVNGRNALNWADRLRLDVEYVDNRSWAVDCRILVRTVGKVLRREGITSDGSTVGSRFTGTEHGGP